jgi:stage II sporulation protein AA (anti-sigma F factor antagonist)
MTGALEFTISRSATWTLISVAGELNAATAPELHSILQEFSLQSVTVDLHAVTFIDPSGLATLLRAHERITLAGGRLAIRSQRPSALSTVEITGVTDRFADDPLVA